MPLPPSAALPSSPFPVRGSARPGTGGEGDERRDVLVVGAGLIGAAAALGLARAGLHVGWIVAAAPNAAPGGTPAAEAAEGWDSRVYAVSPGSVRWLSELGAWQHVQAERVCAVGAIEVSGDDGAAGIVFDAALARCTELATICESGNLARALDIAVAGCGDGIRRFTGRVTELRIGERTASVRLDCGTLLAAPLVVAADGADSVLRELAGLRSHVHDYGHTGVVANFRAQVPHHGVARQWFFGDSVLALLPLPGDRRSMVWSCRDDQAQYLRALDAAALAHEVERVSGGETGALEPLGPARGFPLRRLHVDSPVAARLALVGDAAHSVHPRAGQGMNLGFADCRELVGVLAARGPQSDVGDLHLLRRYARARAEPVASMRWATDGLFRLFRSELPGLPRLRNLGLTWVDRSAALKRRLIAAAIG